MERKLFSGESTAEINKVGKPRTFRTGDIFSLGNLEESLPELSAMMAAQCDVDAWVERALCGAAMQIAIGRR
jgi:hypothetical protein